MEKSQMENPHSNYLIERYKLISLQKNLLLCINFKTFSRSVEFEYVFPKAYPQKAMFLTHLCKPQ